MYDNQMHVIALRWFGVPLANFTAVQNHTLISLLLWGLVGIAIGLALALRSSSASRAGWSSAAARCARQRSNCRW